MLNFTSRLLARTVRLTLKQYRMPLMMNFSTKINASNPTFAKIKQVFLEKGKDSKQYQQQMAKAMRQYLGKYDYQSAMDLERFHLGLLKQSQGETSELYRSQIRQITRFAINRQDFQGALDLVQQLKKVQGKIQNISPLDVTATDYLHGYVLMHMNRDEQAKKQFQKCLERKHVQQGPQVFFKIRAELARVHVKLGEKQKAYKQIEQLQQFLGKRQIDPKAPPMILMMDLQDAFNLAELASLLNDRKLADKYLNLYQQRLQKCSNKKDPFYIQFLQRKAKVYFNMKDFKEAVALLKEAAKMSEQFSKVDGRFEQNAKIFNNIAQQITKEHLK